LIFLSVCVVSLNIITRYSKTVILKSKPNTLALMKQAFYVIAAIGIAYGSQDRILYISL